MQRIKTFLTFAEGAEDAAALYVSVFANSKVTRTTRYGESGPGTPGSVMTVEFELDGQEFVALNGGAQFSFTDGISLAVACSNQEEVDKYWDALTADGGQPVACGWLKDRFGVSWQITPTVLMQVIGDPDPVRARRVMEAMMGMVKIDIAALERAYAG